MKNLRKFIVALSALLLLAAAAARGGEATQVRFFTPAGMDGPAAGLEVEAELEGSCFGPSLASPARPDAWRCSAGNDILDPCFAGPGQAGPLLCAADPFGSEVKQLALAEELPAGREDGGGDLPWALELHNDGRCTMLTGATAALAGKRIDYGCADGGVIAGGVDRTGPVWTVLYRAGDAPFLEQVPVRRAWF